MSNQFLELIQKRRSIYAIGRNVQHSPEQLTEIIKSAIKHSPSAFNSQTARIVMLFNAEHEKFWNIVKETLKQFAANAEAAAKTDAKINGFAAGVGTVLFFEDQDLVKNLQEQFPLYAQHFPAWSEHSTAIAQFSTWTALAVEGIGASLQHYNPVIDDKVHEEWQIPAHWKLRAQLVFGSIEAPAGEKTYMDDAERFKVFK